MEQKPTVGRSVHYFDKDGICRAAIITAVREKVEDIDVIDLTFFEPGKDGSKSATKVFLHNEEKSVLSWHWPERV